MIRTLRLLAMLLSLLAGASLAASESEQRIVAVGDVHGDYEAFVEIVEEAGISDAKARWQGGDAIFIQLGDVTDRGPDSLKIIQHLQKLERDAAKKGGQVVVLVGNHEAMNITGDLRYVHPGEFDAFRDRNSKALRDRLFELNRDSILAFYRRDNPDLPESDARAKWFEANPLGKFEHRRAWKPDGEVGEWIVQHNAIARIGNTLFVHGGISVETVQRPMDAVNEEIRTELAKGENNAPSILTDEFGPLWYRGNVQREIPTPPLEGEAPPPPVRPSIEDELTKVLGAYDAKRLVVAHTPDLKGIIASGDGRLVRVDTGISAYYGGPRSYLVIVGDCAVARQADNEGHWTTNRLPNPEGAQQCD